MPDMSWEGPAVTLPTTTGSVPKGQCVTGKRVFYAERLASRAVTEAAKRGELPPMRHYACPDCGYWHLSKKTRPAGQRDNA